MGMFWQFFALDRSQWDELFGGGHPNAEKLVIAAATWHRDENLDLDFDETRLDEYLDTLERRAPEQTKRIARKICADGVSYAGLSDAEAAELDHMIVGWFCPEGLETHLGYRYAHRCGLSAKAIAELLRCARPGLMARLRGAGRALPQLTAFEKGRRFGQAAPPQEAAPYVVFTAEEASEALSEWDRLMEGPAGSSMGFRQHLEDELITGLRAAVAERQWFAARHT